MEREVGIRKYQLEILKEALELNIGKAPVPTRQTTLSRQTSNYTSSGAGKAGLMSILYLKAHACSPCNMPVIEGLINAAAGNNHFQIASHNSNRHFLQPVIQHNGLAESERVTWLSGKLYEYHQPVYDAELLFIDPAGFILGVLPLELLKERTLFDSWLAPLSNSHSSYDSKSSDEYNETPNFNSSIKNPGTHTFYLEPL
ncbi:MAG: hypothetical protein EA412_00805 [Chitinophagaceae bacterium]|nr:MAG: hypothetical protein EA412_00805 [Chitinophagaceae bacterium]